MRSEHEANIAMQHQALAMQMGMAWAKPAPKRERPAKGILARFWAILF